MESGLNPSLNSDEGGRVNEIIAKQAGVGKDTISKVEKILSDADDETKAKQR